jgi:RNA polymerase sigma-70 factor, ECF subfamily
VVDLEKRTDEALMLRFLEGDVKAFETLFLRYSNLKNYVRFRINSPDTAEDIVQKVWLKIVKRKEYYKPSAKFKTFLYVAVDNQIKDFYRSETRNQSRRDYDEDLESQPATAIPGNRSIEVEYLEQECIDHLKNCIGQLPENQRQCLLLKFEGELGLQEISETIGKKLDTVKSRLRYARDKLGHCMPTECLDSIGWEVTV